MLRTRSLTTFAVLAAIFSPFLSNPVMADHIDRWEIRQTVRHLEERNDALQDRLYDWISQRRDEREHRAGDMLRAADSFDQNIAHFKLDLYHHDDPWDVRDNAQSVIDSAAELGRTIEHDDEWHGELRHEWEDVRDTANELAREYHLRELDHWHEGDGHR